MGTQCQLEGTKIYYSYPNILMKKRRLGTHQAAALNQISGKEPLEIMNYYEKADYYV